MCPRSLSVRAICDGGENVSVAGKRVTEATQPLPTKSSYGIHEFWVCEQVAAVLLYHFGPGPILPNSERVPPSAPSADVYIVVIGCSNVYNSRLHKVHFAPGLRRPGVNRFHGVTHGINVLQGSLLRRGSQFSLHAALCEPRRTV